MEKITIEQAEAILGKSLAQDWLTQVNLLIEKANSIKPEPVEPVEYDDAAFLSRFKENVLADVRRNPVEPVDPHAELKAMYAQQVKDGTLDDFVWEYKGASDTDFPSDWMLELPEFRETLQYRCTPKPTCQVKNLDTGELKVMTREKAKLLQAELGDTVEWSHDTFELLAPIGHLLFNSDDGIYTYKQKANLVKLNGKLMSREAAIAEWESKKDTCDLWNKNRLITRLCEYPSWHYYDELDKHEYELRERPLKQIEWDNLPSGVAVKDSDGHIYVYCGMANLNDAVVLESAEVGNWKCAIEIRKKDLTLAPADQQLFIARQNTYDGEIEGLIYEWRDSESYRIVGIAKGWTP